jgi:hypothetical protein
VGRARSAIYGVKNEAEISEFYGKTRKFEVIPFYEKVFICVLE